MEPALSQAAEEGPKLGATVVTIVWAKGVPASQMPSKVTRKVSRTSGLESSTSQAAAQFPVVW